MALTDDEIKDLALRMLENTRKMIEGEALGQAEFTVSPDKSLATLLTQAWGRHDAEGNRMALMLVVSERKSDIDDATMRFDVWRTSDR